MNARYRLRVDPIACDARALCAELLPEMITLDDWGFPIVSKDDVPPGLLDEAAEVVRICPMLALRLELHSPGPGGAERTGPKARQGERKALALALVLGPKVTRRGERSSRHPFPPVVNGPVLHQGRPRPQRH